MEKFEPISLEEINELIPQYSDKADVIADKYKINLRKQIIELSNEFADAYEIDSALENKDNKHQKYCLVFNPAYPVQIEFMNFVYRNGLVYFPEIYALAVTFISQYKQERLVVILERITTKSLAQHLAESRNFSVDFIKKTILIPMYKFLSILEKNNLSYGCINPDNIFLDSNNELIFNERFSTPPGYNQYCLFETTGRAMVEKKFLKGEAKITDDFYALGVLILVLFSGNNKFYDVDTKIIISGKLQSNSYSYVLSLLPKLEISSDINDLLIGLLMDKLSDRWGAYKLFEWIKGKQYNLMVPSDKIDSPRSINFNGTKFFNREALAYELYINWNKAKKFLRDESLIKWIESSIGNVPLANSIKEIKKDTFKTMSNLAFDWSDYTVCRIIAALDPDGPLRIHHLSINLNAVGFALAYYYSNNNSDYVWLISSIIKTELLSEIFMNRSKNRQLEQNNRYFAWQMVFEKCIEYIKNDNCGFGIERCIYELNPALPCKSTITKNYYAFDINKFIEGLNSALQDNNSKEDIFDQHICAYMAKFIRLPNEIKLRSLALFPDISKNNDLIKFTLICATLKKANFSQMPIITKNFFPKFEEILSHLHSKTLKDSQLKHINKMCDAGEYQKVLALMTNAGVYAKDQMGFKNAKKKYAILYHKTMSLTNYSQISTRGYRYGLQVSIIIAYLLCAIEILYLVTKNM